MSKLTLLKNFIIYLLITSLAMTVSPAIAATDPVDVNNESIFVFPSISTPIVKVKEAKSSKSSIKPPEKPVQESNQQVRVAQQSQNQAPAPVADTPKPKKPSPKKTQLIKPKEEEIPVKEPAVVPDTGTTESDDQSGSMRQSNDDVIQPVPDKPKPETPDQQVQLKEVEEMVEGELLVEFNEGTTPEQIDDVLGRLASSIDHEVSPLTYLLKINDGVAVQDKVNQFKGEPTVKSADPNYVRKLVPVEDPKPIEAPQNNQQPNEPNHQELIQPKPGPNPNVQPEPHDNYQKPKVEPNEHKTGSQKQYFKKPTIKENVQIIKNRTFEVSPNDIEIIEKREENKQVFRRSDGSEYVKVYSAPIYYKDENGQLKEIKDSLVKNEESGFYENAAGQNKVQFGADNTKNPLVSFEAQDFSYTLTPVDPQQSTEEPFVEENRITYKDVYQATDLRFHFLRDEIKTDIILKEYTGINEYKFDLKLSSNASLVRNESGQWQIVSAEGKVLNYLASPYMFDSNEQALFSSDVSLDATLTRDNTYLITYTLDSDWLQSPELKYPVIVDPTTVNIGATKDTHVRQSSPSASFNGYKSNLSYVDYVMSVGKVNGYLNFSYIYFNTGLDSNDNVLSAQLNLYSPWASGNPKVSLNDLTSPWDEGGLNWNNKPSNGATYAANVTTSTGTWSQFDATELVRAWQSSGYNNGVRLFTEDAGEVYFSTKEEAACHPARMPYLLLEYNNKPATSFVSVEGDNHRRTLSWNFNGNDPGESLNMSDLEIATDSNFSTIVNGYSGSATSHITIQLDGGTYYARVSVFDGFDWSDYAYTQFTITKPSTVMAKPTGSFNTHKPNLSWSYTGSEAPFQKSYLQISTESTFNDVTKIAFDNDNITATTYNPELASGIYYARTMVYDGFEWSDWSTIETFTVNKPVAVFTGSASSSTNNIINDVFYYYTSNAGFNWNIVYDDPLKMSHIQIAHDPNFLNQVYAQDVNGLNYVLNTPLEEGKYYFRAKVGTALYDDAEWSDFFTPISFEVNTTYLTKTTVGLTSDKLPAATTTTIPVTIKNEGKGVLRASGDDQVFLSLSFKELASGLAVENLANNPIPLPYDLPVGQTAYLNVLVQTPTSPGSYKLAVEPKTNSFSLTDKGVPAFEATVDVQSTHVYSLEGRGPPTMNENESASLPLKLTNLSAASFSSSDVTLQARWYFEGRVVKVENFSLPDIAPNLPTDLSININSPSNSGIYKVVIDTFKISSSQTGIYYGNQPLEFYVAVDTLGKKDYTFDGPVNLTNGNLVLSETDVNITGRGPDNFIERTYNSQANTNGLFGNNWSSNLETKLVNDGSNIRYIAADGSEYVFSTDAWYSPDFAKRAAINLNNLSSSQALFEYQVKVVVPYRSDMQSDFDDVRFTDSDKLTPLNYWMEGYLPGVSAVFWVKVPAIQPYSIKSIYMYYGNENVITSSDGNKTFEFFDDFSGTTIDNSKWVKADTGNNISQNNQLTITNGTATWGQTAMYSVANFNRSGLVAQLNYKSTLTNGTNYKDTTMLMFKDATSGTSYSDFPYALYAHKHYASVTNDFYMYEDGAQKARIGDFLQSTQYYMRQILKSSGGATTQISTDGINWSTLYDSNYSTESPLKVGFTHYEGGVVNIDNFLVRKYAAFEPVVTIDMPKAYLDNQVYSAENGVYLWLTKKTDGYEIADKAKNIFKFNLAGLPTAISDTSGNTKTLNYDANNRIVSIDEASNDPNRRINIFYNPEGKIESIDYLIPDKLANIKALIYQYDANGNLASYVFDKTDITQNYTGLNTTTTYQYDANKKLTSVINNANEVTGFVYDSESRVDKIIDPRSTTDNPIEKTYNYDPDAGKWYSADWTKRLPVVVNNPANQALTDYQVKLRVPYQIGMQTNFSDLRFTDTDKITELSYWIENYTSGVSATVWIKVPSIKAQETKTIYMYYGNPIASSAGSASAPFPFYDTFSSGNYLYNNEFNVSNLVGYWSFDEGAGTVASDKSPNRNNATLLNNPTWTTAPNSGGLQFNSDTNGNGLYVDSGEYAQWASAPNNVAYNNLSQITLSGWIKLGSTGNGHSIIEKWGSFGLRATTTLLTGVIWSSNGSIYQLDQPVNLNRNQFYYVVFTYDGLTEKLYLDGNLIGSREAAGNTATATSDAWIGANVGGGQVTGVIGEIKIFNRALTSSEIANQYQTTAGNWIIKQPQGWSAAPARWSFSNNQLISTYNGVTGYNVIVDKNTNFTSIPAIVDVDVYADNSSSWGGIWYKGLYFDLIARWGPRDGSENYLGAISKNTWHNVRLVFSRNDNGTIRYDSYLDGNIVQSRDILSSFNFSDNYIGLVSTYDGGTTYWDNYKVSTIPSWSTNAGSWTVENGQIKGIGAGGGIDAWIYAGDDAWTDYAYEAKASFITGEADFVFRSTEHWKNEYRLILWSKDAPVSLPNGAPNSLTLIKHKNGVVTYLVSNAPITEQISGSAQVRIETVGASIKVYINNTKVIDITDSDPLSNGKVGLGVIWNWQNKFDDVKVTQVYRPLAWIDTSANSGQVIITNADAKTTYIFNKELNLATTKDNNERETNLFYNPKGLLIAKDEERQISVYEYDNNEANGRGNVTKSFTIQKDNGFYTVTKTKYEVDWPVKEIDELGNPDGVLYDETGNILNEIDADGETRVNQFDSYGNLISETEGVFPNENLATPVNFWSKRAQVTIDNAANSINLTNYQVKLIIPYSFGMKSDFSDLRFTDSDKITEISYWVEGYTVSNSATVWIKVPSISANSTKTIYMYYGNPNAVSASNGANTFEQFNVQGINGFWSLDEISLNGTAGEVKDQTGISNGVAGGGANTVADAKYGRAAYFDGVNDYINLGNNSTLNIQGPITIESWIKPGSSQMQWADIINRHQGNGDWTLQQDVTNLNRYIFWYWNSSSWQPSTSFQLSANEWQHVMVEKDGSTVRIFVNGVQVVSQVLTGDIVYANWPLWLGGNQAYGRYFNGQIDEVKIYSRALSAGEVAIMYSNYLQKMGSYYNVRKHSAIEPTALISAVEASQDRGNGLWYATSINGYQQDIKVKESTEYTASIYIKTDGSKLSEADSGARFVVQYMDAGGTVIGSEQTKYFATNNKWLRLSLVVKTPENAKNVRILVDKANFNGSLFIDKLQFETGATLTDYNLIVNSGAEIQQDGKATNWQMNSSQLQTNQLKVLSGSASFGLSAGDSYVTTIVQQGIEANKTYDLSAWLKTESDGASDGGAGLEITYYDAAGNILKADGSPLYQTKSAKLLEEDFSLGLVGDWDFDETNSSTVYDKSASGNNGTIYGPTRLDGKYGGALSFDGVDDYTKLPASQVFGISDSLTISMWLNPRDLSKALSGIFGPFGELAFTHLHIDNTGKVLGYLYGPNFYYYSNSQISLNVWTHLTVTYKSGLGVNVYINGNLDWSSGAQSGFLNQTSFNLRLGSVWDSGRYFNGSIDGVKIYKSALTAQEVLAQYQNKPTGISWEKLSGDWTVKTDSSLAASYLFDENAGTTVYDKSGNGRNGAIVGTTSWSTGKSGSGITTSGNGYISVPTVDISTQWSIETWFLAPVPQPTGNWATLTRGTNDHQVIAYEGRDLGTYDNAGGTGFHDSGFDLTSLSSGWHHLVAVGTASGTTDYYIDGTLKGSSNFRSTIDIVAIGNFQGGGQPFGTIDEVKIYNRAFTAQEIQAQYAKSSNAVLLAQQSETGTTFNQTGSYDWTDYVFESDIRLESANEEARLSFRVQPETRGHYEIAFKGGTDDSLILYQTATAAAGYLELTRAKLDFNVQTNINYHIAIEVNKDRIKVFVDGKLYLTATDDTYTKGAIAFGTEKTKASFDNLKVSKLTNWQAVALTSTAPANAISATIKLLQNNLNGNSYFDAVRLVETKTKHFTYDANNNYVVKSVDDSNVVTESTYDSLGRLVQTSTYSLLTPNASRLTAFTYDKAGRILTKTDAMGNTTTYTYDAAGRVATTTDPQGNATSYTYLPGGLLDTETDAQGIVVKNEYDNQNRLTKTINDFGEGKLNQSTTRVYDISGNVIQVIDPEGHITSYTYNDYNEQIKEIDPNNNPTYYYYDNAGRRIKTVDALGFTSYSVYDASGQLIGQIGPRKPKTRSKHYQ